MSIIKHRLFSKNNSTRTHWYPSGGPAVAISNLHPHHLAAIVDLYESEAKKVLEELGFQILLSAPLHSRVQQFLRKHVPAWDAIKNYQFQIKSENPVLYKQLFEDKKYTIKRERELNQRVALDIENLVGKMFPMNFGSEKIGKTAPEFKPRYEPFYYTDKPNPIKPASSKEMLRLKIVQARVMLIEMEDLLSKL